MADLPQTDWSMLGHLARSDAPGRAQALEQLVRRYWPAIYAYIRRTGRDVHESSDLTQGFITTVILQRDLPAKADQGRGRFRSLLLRALQNYLTERHRYDARRRLRRRKAESESRSSAVSLNPFELEAADPGDFESPEAAFAYHWSASIVRRVLDQVRSTCLNDGLSTHWRLFEARVARPLLFGDRPPDLATLIACHEVSTTGKASNMIVTVKRRFARLLMEEIRSTLEEGESPEAELASLLDDLAGTRRMARRPL